MLALGDPLPDVALEGSDGAAVALASLHAGAPLVAILLRHFG